jgi:hypothetical protein
MIQHSAILDLDLRSSVLFHDGKRVISVTDMCVMSVFDLQKISSLLNMVGSTEESIHLLQGDLLGLGNEEPYEESE